MALFVVLLSLIEQRSEERESFLDRLMVAPSISRLIPFLSEIMLRKSCEEDKGLVS